MIHANKIALAYGDQVIFRNNSFIINQEQRVGLVGRNGAGKSTLLKVIAGEQQLDEGSITIVKNKSIAYLSQDVVLESTKTILEETLSVFGHLQQLKQEQQLLEDRLTKQEHHSNILERYASVCEELAQFNSDQAIAETKRVLIGLGFSQVHFDQPVTMLSGGWKMRLMIAKLLLKKADFYLFDEPTNHLDIKAKDWFLDFLKKARFGFILVCHDRYFLDQLCSTILELELGQAKLYSGNYTDYEKQKEQETAQIQVAYEQQQREIKAKMVTIERFRASATKAKMAQSMLKSLNKIEMITIPPKPKTINFSFPAVIKPGKIVLSVKNVAHRFSTPVFENVSFELERDERVAIIAPNGAGKTTLFNLIADKLPVQAGRIDFGYNVKHAIFDQDQNVSLVPEKTIFESIKEACTTVPEQVIRNFLGGFLFSNEEVDKKIKVLSGGEKNRVGMVRLLLQQANLLLLDEPTNHLDIPSKEVLLKALTQYKGTLVFVSHDHDFLNRLATRCIELTPQGVFSYKGNYESYLYAQQQLQQNQENLLQKKLPPAFFKSFNKDRFALNKKARSLEQKIETLEQSIKTLEGSFTVLVYGSREFNQAQEKLQEMQKQHQECFNEWAKIQEQLES